MKTYKLTSTGRTGADWITHLESKGFRIGTYAKQLLNSPDFKPTNGVTYEVAIHKIEGFKTTKQIRGEAKKLGYETPNAELACLIRENISDDEIRKMGLWYIVTMHEPIKDSVGAPLVLGSDRDDDGRWLSARYGGPGVKWRDSGGFAFVVSQSTQSFDTQNSSVPLTLTLSPTDLTILKSSLDVISKILKVYE